jgi:hypothetical protein
MFNIGDRVVDSRFGAGYIVEIKKNDPLYLVTHDKTRPQLHRGNSINSDNYKEHSCWWYEEYELRKTEEEV